MDLLAVLPEGPSTTSMAARVQNIVELYGVQPPPPNMLALSLFLLLHLWEPAAQDWPVRREHMLQRTSA